MGWNLLIQIARHHQVWALTNAADRPSLEEAWAKDPVPNINFSYVGLPRWLRPLLRIQGGHQFYYHLWQLWAYFAARKLHKEHRFDLFHHVTYANDWLASFIGALLPVPYVRGPGGGAHRTPKGFEGEYTLGGRIWEKVRSVFQWILRHEPLFIIGQRRARAILVCNRASQSKFPKNWSSKVHLFPVSGVSTSDLSFSATPTPEDGRFRVLTAGSLIRVKGFGLAIRAFQQFAKNRPEAEFWIFGSGPEEARLRALVRRENLEDKVHLKGAVPRDDLLAEMAQQDVFLFPSLRDGGGTVVIEAMALGKPVVCLDTGGPGMHITPECGIKISPRSRSEAVVDLAGALERLYSDPNLRQTLGEAGRRKAEEEYHWDRLGQRLMGIYEQAMSSGVSP